MEVKNANTEQHGHYLGIGIQGWTSFQYFNAIPVVYVDWSLIDSVKYLGKTFEHPDSVLRYLNASYLGTYQALRSQHTPSAFSETDIEPHEALAARMRKPGGKTLCRITHVLLQTIQTIPNLVNGAISPDDGV